MAMVMLQMQQFDFEFVEKIFSEINNISLKILTLMDDNTIEQEFKLLELQKMFENRGNLLEDLKELHNTDLWKTIFGGNDEFLQKKFSEFEILDVEINKKLTNIVNDIGANIRNLVKSSAVLKYYEG